MLIKVCFGQNKIKNILKDNVMSEVGFGIGYRVYNSYPFPLYIKTKSGLDYRVPARDMDKADMGTYVIVTFHKLNYNSVTKVNPDKALTLFDKQVMEKFNEEFKERQSNIRAYGIGSDSKYEWDIVVRVDLHANIVEPDTKHAIHSELLGTTFYLGDESYSCPPINTPEEVGERTNTKLAKQYDLVKASLVLNIFINDPNQIMSPYWVNSMGIARKIPSVSREDMPCGIYVTEQTSDSAPHSRYYSFAELTDKTLESIGIHRNKSDALKMSNGERIVELDTSVKNLTKTMDKLKGEKEYLKEELNKETIQTQKTASINFKLMTEFTTYKFESRIKDATTKLNQEYSKTRSGITNFMDMCKLVSSVMAVGVTVCKLLK